MRTTAEAKWAAVPIAKSGHRRRCLLQRFLPLEEVHMLVGTVAGMAVLYELVSWAAHRQLSQHLHSPSDVWLTAVLMIVIGIPAAVSFPRLVRSFAFLVAVAAAVAASVAAYSN